MANCLITKLKGSVSNKEILRIGEMRIQFDKVKVPTEGTQGFTVGVNAPVTLEIIGDGYFTDNTLVTNKGKTQELPAGRSTIWVSNSDLLVAVLDKYKVNVVEVYYPNGGVSSFASNKHLNLDAFKYSVNFDSMDLSGTQTSGNVEDLKNLTAIRSLSLRNTKVSGNVGELKTLAAVDNLSLNNTQVSGNVGELSALTKLVNFYINNTQVSGNVGDLKTLTKARQINLSNTKVSGNVGELSTLTALENLFLDNTLVTCNMSDLKKVVSLKGFSISNKQTPPTGDIGELNSLSKLINLSLNGARLTGDLATLPSTCRYVSLNDNIDSVFSWGTRPSSAKIIAIIGHPHIENVDKMLQDQAQCVVGFSTGEDQVYKIISCAGTRTSASDAAVQTLQSKGYTISIIPA